MAGSKSNYYENVVLNMMYGSGNPATIYAALCTSTLSADSSTFTEVSGTGYSRVAITNNATNWPAASSSQKKNGTRITFPATGAGGWGTVRGLAFFDAYTGGNMMHWFSITAATPTEGDVINFPVNSIVITED